MKIMNKITEYWSKITGELKIFIIYFVLCLSLIILFNFEFSKISKIFILFSLFFCQLSYSIWHSVITWKNGKYKSVLFLDWYGVIVLFLFAFAYGNIVTGENVQTGLMISVILLELSIFIAIFGSVLFGLFALLKIGDKHFESESVKLVFIVLYYLCVVIMTSFLFGFVFLLCGNSENALKYVDGAQLTAPWDQIYFSASTFYSNSPGDILPYGFSKLFIILELIVSAIIHTIFIGRVVSKIDQYDKCLSEDKKESVVASKLEEH